MNTRRILMWRNPKGSPTPKDIELLRSRTDFKIIEISGSNALVEGDQTRIDSFARENGWKSHPEVKYRIPEIRPHLTPPRRRTAV